MIKSRFFIVSNVRKNTALSFVIIPTCLLQQIMVNAMHAGLFDVAKRCTNHASLIKKLGKTNSGNNKLELVNNNNTNNNINQARLIAEQQRTVATGSTQFQYHHADSAWTTKICELLWASGWVRSFVNHTDAFVGLGLQSTLVALMCSRADETRVDHR